jgi:hypothetical protein
LGRKTFVDKIGKNIFAQILYDEIKKIRFLHFSCLNVYGCEIWSLTPREERTLMSSVLEIKGEEAKKAGRKRDA